MLRNGQDPSEEVSTAQIESCELTFTSDPSQLANASFHIVAVPTPLLASREPDLEPLLSASRTVGRALKKGDIVVLREHGLSRMHRRRMRPTTWRPRAD